MPGMLRGILADAIDRERDLHLVGQSDAEVDLMDQIGIHRPNVLLIGEPTEPHHHAWPELLGAYPQLKVLAVEGSARSASLYELAPRRTHLGEASPGLLTSWIKQSALPMTVTAVEAAAPGGEAGPAQPLGPEGVFAWPERGDQS